MKQLLPTLSVLFTAITLNAQTGYIPQFTGSAIGGTSASYIYQDPTSSFVGIGQAAPSSNLDVYGIPELGIETQVNPYSVILSEYNVSNYQENTYGAITPPYYYAAQRDYPLCFECTPTPPNVDFTVNGVGQVGIGIANSGTVGIDLLINTHGWNSDPCVNMNPAIGIMDDNSTPLLIAGNNGNSTDGSGMLEILGNSNITCGNLNFAVFDAGRVTDGQNNMVFAACSQGIVTMGTSSPVANFDFNANITSYGIFYPGPPLLLHVGDITQSNPNFFSIDDDGHIGIGSVNTGQALTLIDDVNDISASGHPQFLITDPDNDIKFMVMDNSAGIGINANATGYQSQLVMKGGSENGTSMALFAGGSSGADNAIQFWDASSNLKDLIFDDVRDGGDVLTILPRFDLYTSLTGLGTLHVIGNENIDGYASIGTTCGIGIAAGSSTLTIQGAGGTTIDMHESSGVAGWDDQIRFMTISGTPRHIIADDVGVTNNLIIYPGYAGGGNNTVEVEGNQIVTGTLQIGTTVTGEPLADEVLPNFSLSVAGQIVSQELIVQVTSWSDTVFSDDYRLKPLSEVQNYIQQNHHLPDVPDECDVMKHGVSVGEMNATLLKKVEELTLYTLQQQKQIDDLQQQLNRIAK